ADDYKDISVRARLITEITAALIMVEWGNTEIKSLGNLLGFGEIRLGPFSIAFTVIAVVGGINAFNMIDGIDGLAGSLSLLVFIFLLVLGLLFDNAGLSMLCSNFIPAIVAFLLFNLRIPGRNKASIFLGNAGSTLLGFTICWSIISVTQGEGRIISPVTVLWIIAVPLFDTVSIVIRRMRNRRSPFAADREHFHHIVLAAGHGVNQTLAIILLFSIILAIIGWASDLVFKIPEWCMFYLFLGLFALYHWGIYRALASYPLRNS
ncbi:MAG: hypothetical protein ACRERV_02110, partial [Methylococcales bacterium]